MIEIYLQQQCRQVQRNRDLTEIRHSTTNFQTTTLKLTKCGESSPTNNRSHTYLMKTGFSRACENSPDIGFVFTAAHSHQLPYQRARVHSKHTQK